MAYDVGNSPVGTPPTEAQQIQTRSALGITTLFSAETAARIEADNRRAFAGGVYGAGVSGALDYMLIGAPIPALGTGDLSVFWHGEIAYLAGGLGDGILRSGTSGADRLIITYNVNSAGSSADLGNVRIAIGTSAFSIDLGAVSTLNDLANWCISLDRDGLAVLYKDGVNIGSVDISAASANVVSGNAWEFFSRHYSAMTASDLAIANFAPTAAQAAEIAAEGVQPWFARHPEYARGGSALTLSTAVNDATNGYETFSGATTTGFSAANTDSAFDFAYLPITETPAVGDKIRVTGSLTLNSGTGVRVTIRNAGGIASDIIDVTSSGSFTADLTLSTVGGVRLAFMTPTGGGNVDFVVSSVALTTIGALSINPLTGPLYQYHDITGNGNHLLASATGVYPLVSKDEGKVSGSGLNGDAGTAYLLRAGNVLPENVVVTGVAVDGVYHAATGAQDQAYQRIAFVTSASNVLIQRHNGTTAQTIATATPTSTANFSLTVYFKAL